MENIERVATPFEELQGLNMPWETVLHMARRHAFPKGHRIMRDSELYFIKKGSVALMQQNLDGLEKIVWLMKDGCIFGETPFFFPHLVEAYCVCMSECVIFSFSKRSMAVIGKEYPDLPANLLYSMSVKMCILIKQAASLYLDNARTRLCKFLAQRILPGSDPPIVDIGMSRQDLASYIGINRISLYKLLCNLEELDIIRQQKGRKIVISNPEMFYRIVNS